MNRSRRQTFKIAGGAGLYAALAAIGLVNPAAAQGFDRSLAFQAKSVQDALKALGAASPTESKEIVITAPEIAENGAVVPVSVRSAVPKTEQISLLVEKNPNLLAGSYDILDGLDPEISMRI